MRTCAFQYSTLMMVMVMMMMMAAFVCSASIHCTDSICMQLRKDIKHEAFNLSNSVAEDIWVAKISGAERLCVNHFFCLAEKALETITDTKPLKNGTVDKPETRQLEKLIRLLKQYNNKTNDTHCKLHSNMTVKLRSFLKDMVKCVNFTLNS